MKIMLFILLMGSMAVASSAPSKPVFCTPDNKVEARRCLCLQYHPEHEFCEDETLPIPSCCKAAEKDSGVTHCGCCASVDGKKIDVRKRGTYKHEPPVVEYER